jgi:integration host factor beta subunit
MKKSDLVDTVAAKTEQAKNLVQLVVDGTIDAIADALASGDKIDLRGFGTFGVRESAARTGRNPQTGEAINIPARRVPTFKPGKELKDKVNTHGSAHHQAEQHQHKA